MLTLNDCIGLSDLTEAEIRAIAEHEHMPEIVAMEYGQYLIENPAGEPCIQAIILDHIRLAEDRGDQDHAVKLKLVLQHFVDQHAALGA